MGESELESFGSDQKQVAGPYEHGYKLDMIRKLTNISKRLRLPCIINTVCLLHFSATLLATLMAMRYKEYITIV